MLHHVGYLPGPGDDLADAAHRLGVGGRDRQSADVVQDVFRRDRGGADAGLREREVFGHRGVEVMTDHEHVEMLSDRVHCVRERGIGRAGDDVRVTRQREDVGRVPAARSFDVEGMDRSARDRGDRGLDEACFVQRVGVQRHLQAPLVGSAERRIDRGGR